MQHIVILTGAGISAESGLGTFRDKDGLWTKVNLEDVATPEGYARNPDMVLDFYNQRRRGMVEAKPNAAHEALGRLEAAWPGKLTLVTQNIDNLHEQGGSREVIHMHGEMLRALCSSCGYQWDWPGDMSRSD
ncbi:MAG: Sir2 family NAD-dependent protein deacetylase, partial [Pseudomonadota bacterium]